MTTIIGIRTNHGLDAVVFGADTQVNYEYADQNEGPKKGLIYKIISGRNWMLGSAGGVHHELYRFQQMLTRPKNYNSTEEEVAKIIQEAVDNFEKGKKVKRFEGLNFPRVAYLNAQLKRNGESDDQLVEFLLAANIGGKLGMWSIDNFGSLSAADEEKDFEYLVIGSGGEHAEKYIEEQIMERIIDRATIDVATAVRTIKNALRRSEKDLNTGTYKDIAILTKDSVTLYGAKVKELMTKQEDDIFEGIASEWNGHSQ